MKICDSIYVSSGSALQLFLSSNFAFLLQFKLSLEDSSILISCDLLVPIHFSASPLNEIGQAFDVSFSEDFDKGALLEDVPDKSVLDDPSTGKQFLADLFPSNDGLNFTITAVMLSIPVPSFIVSGARQCSNSYNNNIMTIISSLGNII